MTFRSSIASRKKLDGKLLLHKSLAPKLKIVYIAFKFKIEPYLCMAVKSSEKVVFFCSILFILMLMYRLFPVAFVALWFWAQDYTCQKLLYGYFFASNIHSNNNKQYTINQVTSASQDLEIFTDFLFLYPQFLEVDLAL